MQKLHQLELAGRHVKIDTVYRKMVFCIQEYGPTFASTSRTITKAYFLKNGGNYVCPYHSEHRGTTTSGNSKHRHPYKLIGVPGERKYGKKAYPVEPSPGCFHCGCSEEEVLIEFCLWKEWYISSKIDGETIKETFGTQRLDPRTRAFVVQNYCRETSFSLDDFFTNGGITRAQQLIVKQVAWYNEEYGPAQGKILKLTTVPIRAIAPAGSEHKDGHAVKVEGAKTRKDDGAGRRHGGRHGKAEAGPSRHA